MRFLANENFPLTSVRYLQEKGFGISAIGIEKPSIRDEEVLQIAIDEGRTILTFDRDYGELIFKNNLRPEKGIIYFRLSNYSPIEPAYLIEALLNIQDFNPETP